MVVVPQAVCVVVVMVFGRVGWGSKALVVQVVVVGTDEGLNCVFWGQVQGLWTRVGLVPSHLR